MTPKYLIWRDRCRPHPYRWACKSVPNDLEVSHFPHHGGANTDEAATEAANRHAQKLLEVLDSEKT